MNKEVFRLMICYLLKRKSSPHEWAATFDRKN